MNFNYKNLIIIVSTETVHYQLIEYFIHFSIDQRVSENAHSSYTGIAMTVVKTIDLTILTIKNMPLVKLNSLTQR